MLIRSQDKKCIKPIELCNEIYVLDSMVFINGREFGEYSTEEKAIMVLDIICDFAIQKRYEEIIPEQCGFISGQVFQMPSDEEVN